MIKHGIMKPPINADTISTKNAFLPIGVHLRLHHPNGNWVIPNEMGNEMGNERISEISLSPGGMA